MSGSLGKKNLLFRFMIVVFLPSVADGSAFIPQKRLYTPDVFPNTFSSFQDLRYAILNIIGKTKKRIWVLTDFLSDGEIVSALYLAKYRKVSVRVYLGEKKAYNYMSRLGYLQEQKTPVFRKPRDLPFTARTLILSDYHLYFIEGDLDFLNPRKNFEIKVLSRKDTEQFMKIWRGLKVSKRSFLPSSSGKKRVLRERAPDRPVSHSRRVYGKGNQDGSYNYDRNQPLKPPDDISHRLPKDLKSRRSDGLRPYRMRKSGPLVAPRLFNELESKESELRSEDLDDF